MLHCLLQDESSEEGAKTRSTAEYRKKRLQSIKQRNGSTKPDDIYDEVSYPTAQIKQENVFHGTRTHLLSLCHCYTSYTSNQEETTSIYQAKKWKHKTR